MHFTISIQSIKIDALYAPGIFHFNDSSENEVPNGHYACQSSSKNSNSFKTETLLQDLLNLGS